MLLRRSQVGSCCCPPRHPQAPPAPAHQRVAPGPANRLGGPCSRAAVLAGFSDYFLVRTGCVMHVPPLPADTSTETNVQALQDAAATERISTLGLHQDATSVTISSNLRYAASRSSPQPNPSFLGLGDFGNDLPRFPWTLHEAPAASSSKALLDPDTKIMQDPDTKVWDLQDGCILWQGNLGNFTVMALAVHLASGRVLFCDGGGRLLVQPLHEEFGGAFTIRGPAPTAVQASAIGVSADGKHAVSNGGCEMHVWDLQRRRWVREMTAGCMGPVVGVAVSADQRYAAVALHDPAKKTELWDIKSGQRKCTIRGAHEWASFAVTADARFAVSSGGGPRGLRVWHLSDDFQNPVCTLGGQEGPVRAATIAGDVRMVIVTGEEGGTTEMRTWDITRVKYLNLMLSWLLSNF